MRGTKPVAEKGDGSRPNALRNSEDMQWARLIEDDREVLHRGVVLRLRGQWPYEDFVDFMVFDPLEEKHGMGLIVSSGHKAGLISLLLPIESETDGDRGIDRKWLVDNWAKWVYPECDVSDVFVTEHYRAPSSLPENI